MKRIILSSLLVIFVVGCIGIGNREVADNGYMNSGYTKKELEAKGVNTEHLFVFTEKCATYNGQVLAHPIIIGGMHKS